MAHTRIDRLFLRFCRRGDPRALAKVFDATAGELYRLAFHLVGDRHTAEDLVQTTFLTAIEAAPTFDRQQPVMPWLCGILANRARDHRRRRRLMQVTPPPPATTDIQDPIAEASLHELSNAVAQAVRALPEPYRQVLLLHLEHGLGGVDIAETLARPEATVRSQIHRGLDMLRRALPVGITAAASGSAPPAALASVRAVVMAKAGAVAAANGVALATIGGIMATKKAMVGLVGAVVLCLGAWQLLPQRQAVAIDTAATAAPASATVAAAAQTQAAAPTLSERQLVTAAPAAAVTALEVAVRWQDDGVPAEGVVVAYLPQGDRSELLQQSARTNAAGIAHFDRAVPGGCSIAVDRCKQTVRLTLEQGESKRIEYSIPAGVTLRGHIVDARQQPVANADIWLSNDMMGWSGHTVVARSAADGSFTLRSVQPGRELRAQAEGYAPSSPHEVVEQDGAAEIVIELMDAPGVLDGMVSAPDGTPVGDATVCLQFANNPRQFRVDALLQWDHRGARSDASGHFRITGLMPANWVVWACTPDSTTWRQTVPVSPTGPTTLQIRLLEGAEVRGRVTNASGAAFERVRLEALHEAIEPPPNCAYEGPDWAQLSTTTDADGTYALSHVMPGRLLVRASKNMRADGKLFRQTASFELADRQQVHWDPVLGRGLLLHGVVVDPDGAPLAGWLVQSPPPNLLRLVSTDAEGHFQWDQAEDIAYSLQLIPGQELGQAAVTVTDVRPSPDPLRIVVPWARIPSGRFIGRVLAPDGTAPRNLRLSLDRCGEGGDLEGCSGSGSSSDGQLRSIDLFPGRYRVNVYCQDHGALSLGTWDVGRGKTVDLGMHQYLQTGSLTFEVIGSDGKSIPKAKLMVSSESDPLGGTLADASKGVPHLQPGPYLLSTWGNLTMASSPPLDVVSGGTTHYVFRVPEGVRFLERIPSKQLENYVLRECWRDPAGVVVLDTVQWLSFRTGNPLDLPRTIPAGRYSIETEDAAGRKATTTVEIRAADPPMTIELPLPGH